MIKVLLLLLPPLLLPLLLPPMKDTTFTHPRDSMLCRQTVCFVTSYILEIPVQHFLNALLVFRMRSITNAGGLAAGSRSMKRYRSTLLMTYLTYVNSIWISATAKGVLEKFFSIGDPWSFILSVYGTGIISFAVLCKVMKKA